MQKQMTNHELQLEVLKLEEQGLRIMQICQSGMSFNNLPQYSQWMTSVSLLDQRHLQDHPLHKDIENAYFFKNDRQRGFVAMLGLLDTIGKDNEYWQYKAAPSSSLNTPGAGFQPQHAAEAVPVNTASPFNPDSANDAGRKETILTEMNSKVFIVHGHDNEAKQEMARFLQIIGYDPIILHEQPDGGKTIIEKIEAYTDVSFAVVLYTECDLGRKKADPPEKERFRARQNVVFEHGFLIGKLGRDKVCAIVKGNIETPGDITGVVYTKMDAEGAWKLKLAQNMRAAGLFVDGNKLI